MMRKALKMRLPVHDLVYAIRRLRKSPAFVITTVITLGLGIGASTAIFSVADGVLLRALPYDRPDRLVLVMPELRKRHVTDYLLSHADFIDLRDGTRDTFQELGAIVTGRSALPQQNGSLEETRWASVTPNFFRLMGAAVIVGRDFAETDGQTPPPGSALRAASPGMAMILSHAYWQRRFGGDPSVVGREVPGTAPGSTTIVGVLAPGFELLFPASANIEQMPDHWFVTRLVYDDAARNGVSLRAIGRLRDGVTLDQAQAAVDVMAAALRRKSAVWETADFNLRVAPMQPHLVAEVRPALLVLLAGAFLLLLIACANVSNLFLVRTAARQHEIAVRRALGGDVWRVVSPILAEALLLAAGGALLGTGLAWLAIHQLGLIAPPDLPRAGAIAIDRTALAFAAIAALAAAALFSVAPLSLAGRQDGALALRSSGRAPGRSGEGARSGIVVAGVALSFVLLIASGLMLRSFIALHHVPLEYDPEGLLTFRLVGSRGGDQPGQRAAFIREIEAYLRGIAGAEAVAASAPFPLAGGFNATRWGTEEAAADPARLQSADFQTVLPGYFETVRTRLLAGRTFTDADNASGRNVVVVDEMLAAKAFPDRGAVGRRLIVNRNTVAEIIGVVAHQRATSLAEPGREQIYFTDGFMGHGVVSQWAIRTSAQPLALAQAVRSALAPLGSRVAIVQLQPMAALVDRAQANTRFSLLLLALFGVVSALLASVGLYGVLATVLRLRRTEIGVRMALGAAPARIFTLLVGHGLRLSVAGIAIGMVAALGLMRAMSHMLVGVAPSDPATYAVAAALFFVVAFAASWLPARRAAALDPAAVFRQE